MVVVDFTKNHKFIIIVEMAETVKMHIDMVVDLFDIDKVNRLNYFALVLEGKRNINWGNSYLTIIL